MIGKEFIESTKYQYIKTTGHSEKKLAPLIQLPYNPEDMIINLPEPDFFDEQQVNFLEMIELRTTIRHYSDKSMSLKDLSYLLWCTQGVKMVVEKGSLRNVPSAGARHAFETYLLVNNVEGLEKGIYRFLAIEHKLLAIKVDESLLDENGRLDLHKADLVAYSHGEYFALGKKLGKFGFTSLKSEQKENLKVVKTPKGNRTNFKGRKKGRQH